LPITEGYGAADAGGKMTILEIVKVALDQLYGDASAIELS
jgi:hypothetical protein